MEWRKVGRVVEPPNGLEWMESHASVPCALPLDDTTVRVYFSGRDRDRRSRVGYCEIDPRAPHRPPRFAERPVLEPGPAGSFDESGAMASWLVERGGEIWMYYIGWTLGVTVPFYNSIGLAVSRDGGLSFDKAFPGPIVGRDRIDPYFTASSCVLPQADGWRMWYLSATGWTRVDGVPRHAYHIRHAASDDGVDWRRRGEVAIDFAGPEEYAISRPSVLRDGGRYRMWYSYRGEAYRIGYAESNDGAAWTRRDAEAGIDVSPAGWDSEMIEYPCVFDHAGGRFMLYNGNGYGATGIGLAELERD